MEGNSFVGHQPENIRWTMDGKKILFDWNPYDQPGNSTYAYNLKTKEIDSVTGAFYRKNAPYSEIRNGEYALYSLKGNLYSYNLKSHEIREVIHLSDRIHNLQYSPVTDLFYFQLGNSLCSINIKQGTICELVEFKKGTEDKEQELSLMEKEELKLFRYTRDQKAEKEWKESSDIFKDQEIKTIYYNKSSVNNIQISGTGRYITFRVNDYPKNELTHVEHHIASDGHTYTSDARAKVSDQDPNHKLGIYDIGRDTIYYVDFSVLPDIRKKPAYLKDYGDTAEFYTKDRNIIMHELIYSKDGKNNVFDIRSYDNKDRWIVSVDLSNGQLEVYDHQHDEAWIGGPGISSWNMVSGTLGWMPDNQDIYYQSEKSGYSHIYVFDTQGKHKVEITSGNWEVQEVLYVNETDFYFIANKDHPGSYYLYKYHNGKVSMWASTRSMKNIVYSPDRKYIAYLASTKTEPWELYYCENKAGAKQSKITESRTEAFRSYNWYSPDVITFKDEKNEDIYARLYKPENSNGAAVIFVHGAGYLQNAHNYWSLYYREFMFHNLLRDQGFTVLDIDYRASQGYGRDHRTAIYRHMGGSDLDDQLLGKKYLMDSLGIDPERVGIYGGSYGGFITLMALLTKPGEFKCGAALRSVTDWSHYNHEYTSNILNYPGTDPEAYRKSSPIYYAENLEDRLLMLHGMVDDNVQFQDVVRLSERFIEIGKTNWELAVFPVEAHGFKQSYSWADEYRRIFELFKEELLD